jgi:hypothetical protein
MEFAGQGINPSEFRIHRPSGDTADHTDTEESEMWSQQNPPDIDPKIWLEGEERRSINILPTLDTAIDAVTNDDENEPKTPEQESLEILFQNKWLQTTPEQIQKWESTNETAVDTANFLNILEVRYKSGETRQFFQFSYKDTPQMPPNDLKNVDIKLHFYAYELNKPDQFKKDTQVLTAETRSGQSNELATSTLGDKLDFGEFKGGKPVRIERNKTPNITKDDLEAWIHQENNPLFQFEDTAVIQNADIPPELRDAA